MQPESSDGFASVGTILPEEGAALLPGGSFRLVADSSGFVLLGTSCGRNFPVREDWSHRKKLPSNFTASGGNDTIKEQAEVAQLVEQLIRNQQVVGPTPIFGSTFHRFNQTF